MNRSETFIEKVKTKLIQRKQEILHQLANSNAGSDLSGQVKDIGDEALSSSMGKLQSSLEQGEIDEVNLIDAALGRIKRGDYGLCIDCGENISERRLEHSAYAARCIVCQEELENSEI